MCETPPIGALKLSEVIKWKNENWSLIWRPRILLFKIKIQLWKSATTILGLSSCDYVREKTATIASGK